MTASAAVQSPIETEAGFGVRLGEKLRLRRKAMGKTLQQVAEETDLSVSFVSQVERGLSVPSLSSFYKLAKALNAPMEEVLDLSMAKVPVTRKGDREAFVLGEPAVKYEKLSPGFPGAKINVIMMHRPAGATTEVMSHEGEEFIYILKGEVLYELDDEQYRLKEGDAIHYQAERPHRCAAVGPEDAIELWVGTVPLFEMNKD
ncbi:helix-turn-helix domain-containing protein [Cucumibacter marinus]|uniref:helix-turn-helix domain-containing protein n=1 Tax=Cucumibacter marinus TaxID=1121252 RepID=UPI00248176B7|nr:XRE family transcriptional regulator [Cucumibacter marinus]